MVIALRASPGGNPVDGLPPAPSVKPLCAYSGIERREPEAKSRRNVEIKITRIRHQNSKKSKRLGAYSGDRRRMSQEQNLAETWKSVLPA